ncbi:Pentatricopeptide repeat-containing protein [Artemisia annua]|uniref:Pentatricopeptide repeat-containing protein n=1 Tax=Artemisia annua TaxID=35608 RepID=A0A2U1MNV1_ARTAN|nr:Pentatricopeptide repeat-containing protein [Artemisia annua]
MNTLIKSFYQNRPSLFLFRKLLPASFSTSHSVLESYASLGCCYDVRNSFGEFRDAFNVFDEMPMRNNGDLMHSLCRVIKASNNIEKGYFVHDYVKRKGFENHIIVMNSLISMYVKMGRMDLAQQVFDDVVVKDIVSWNSLLTGYAQKQNWPRVFDLFLCLRQADNLVPNVVTYLALLLSVGHANEVGIGMSFHGHLISIGLYSNVQLGTAIFYMYAKCDRLDYAVVVFEQDLINKSLVSWNALIATYKQKGYDAEAADIYERLVLEPDIKPDSFSFANVLPAYGRLGYIQRIKSIHSVIIKRGLDMKGDVVLSTAMLDAYGKCSDVKAAKFLFDCIHQPTTATWNALIAVYNLSDEIENGLNIFGQMVRHKVSLDPITMVTLFQSCGQMGSLKHGKMIHGFSLLKGLSSNLIVGNALIDMYMRCGCTKSAQVFFSSMCTENIVTWNTMIYGYMKNGCSSSGLTLFRQMRFVNEYKPDSVTIISLLQGSLAASGSCYIELIHAYILKQGLVSETQVMNILIDSYAKIGIIDKARDLFMENDFKRDQSSWNIMIAGYGMNGQGSESSKLFYQMQDNGYAPDAITFTSLLSSCSHCGLIEDGCKFFDLMVTKYKIKPTMEHWTCIIDMLGRANGLEEAYDVIRTAISQKYSEGVPLDSVAVWGALLSACNNNMNMKVGGLVGLKLSKMESGDYMYSSLISNLYSSNEKWKEAREIRKVFGDGKLMKKPGVSSLKS